jgi:8-oxo-dGTP pyrophosphatase MutT (NUDIX family)
MDVQRVSRKTVYQNQWIEVFEDRIQRNSVDGLYGVVRRDDAVVTIPISPSGRTLLLNSFRYPTEQWSLEFPMGGIESSEDPYVAAPREFQEETGLVGKVTAVGQFFALPGLTGQKVFVFRADVTDADLEAARTPTATDGSDDIEGQRVVKVADLRDYIREGRISDSLTLCSILLAGL